MCRGGVGGVIDMVATLVKELTNGVVKEESVGVDTAKVKDSMDVSDKIVEADESINGTAKGRGGGGR